MSWQQPFVFVALVAVVAMLWLVLRSARSRRQAMAAFGQIAGGAPAGTAARGGLVTVACALVVVALAGPRFGGELREVRQEGLDLVIALDVSRSMLAEDVAPSRLEKARAEAEVLLDHLPGTRVGVVLFAGRAVPRCPLTSDAAIIRRCLAVAHPEMIPVQGTDLGEAISLASAFLTRDPSAARMRPQSRARAILVISDGEDHAGRSEGAARAAAQDGIAVLAAGIGEPGGARIPVPGEGNFGGYHADRTGRHVVTRLDEDVLRRVARSGMYVRIGQGGASLTDLAPGLRGLAVASEPMEEYVSYAERYQWPLGAALLLLALERGHAIRRRRSRMTV